MLLLDISTPQKGDGPTWHNSYQEFDSIVFFLVERSQAILFFPLS